MEEVVEAKVLESRNLGARYLFIFNEMVLKKQKNKKKEKQKREEDWVNLNQTMMLTLIFERKVINRPKNTIEL